MRYNFHTLLVVLAPLVLGACSSGKDVVVVYSPHGGDVLADYEQRFEAAHPDVDVQWLDNGSNQVYSRVRAEQGRPACDVWWGAPSSMFSQAASEGLLEVYVPTWADALSPAYKDAEGRWHATYVSPLAILYNTTAHDEADIPQTWDDLLDPAWAGKIAIRKPLPSGTMRTFIGATMLREGSDDAGIAWLKKLHAATAEYPESPNLLYDHIKRNPERISVWIQPDIVMQRDLNGFPFGYHIPPQTPVLTDGIAIIKGAPHPELARQFYEFVTSEEALVQQAQAYAKMPARNDVDRSQLPDWMQQVKIDAMSIDWVDFAARESAWCARWEQDVYNARR